MSTPFHTVLQITVATTLIVVIFQSIDPYVVGSSFASIWLIPVSALCVIGFANRVLMAYKWNLLLRARGISISTWQVTSLYFVGHLLGTLTPGAIAADAYRVTSLSHFKQTQTVISTVILERLIGFVVLSLFVMSSLPFSTQYLASDLGPLVWAIVAGTVFISITVVVSLCPYIVKGIAGQIPCLSHIRIAERIRGFYHVYAENRIHVKTLLTFTALTALEVVVHVAITYLAARSVGVGVSFGYFLCVIPLLSLLVRLPISFQGIGVAEGLFAYFLVIGGFTAADGISIALLLRVAEVIVVLLPAGAMLWMNPLRPGVRKAAQ